MARAYSPPLASKGRPARSGAVARKETLMPKALPIDKAKAAKMILAVLARLADANERASVLAAVNSLS